MRLRDTELENALRALADAIQAGISVGAFLGNETAAFALPPAVRSGLRLAIEGGGGLSVGFRRLGVLSGGELAVLGAGEKRGEPEVALRAIADGIAQRRKDRQRLMMGLAYPALLLCAASCLLPLPRIFTHGLLQYVLVSVWIPLMILGGAFYAVVVVPTLPPNDPKLAAVKRGALAVPVLGSALRRGACGTFLQILGRCLSGGLPLGPALQAACVAADHPVFESGMVSMLKAIEGGQSLAEALKGTGIFDPSALALVAQGELMGKLDETLPRAAAQELQVQRRAVIGALVGLVALVAVIVLGLIAWGIIQGMMSYFDTIDSVLKGQTGP